MNRRHFIKNISLVGPALALSSPLTAFAAEKQGLQKLVILHTNDVHSRIEPFPSNSKYPGLGGAAKRAQVINQVRNENEHVLLLDCGDIFQGTPYFNLYGGEVEFKLMSEMGYDAATLGNHDFDGGIDGLVKQLPNAKFPFLNANYNFDNTPLKNKISEYKIVNKGKLKIGILGVGVELDGLVPKPLYGNVIYQNPIEHVNRVSQHLKLTEKCDYIICLSHLGFEYNSDKISDRILASKTKFVDLILGGHTHTFLDKPVFEKNLTGNDVLISQVGWAGMILGRIDVYFDKMRLKKTENRNLEIIS